MKKIIIIFLIILTSCSRNEYEKELIGNWNNFPLDFMSDITFKQDSIITYNYFEKEVGEWKADSSKIYITFLNRTKNHHRKELVLNYRISRNKDTLYTFENLDDYRKEFYLLKVKDYWKHYLKEIDLEINLPKADFEITQIDSEKKGFDIYIGFKNNKLKVKTELTYQEKKVLENLEFFSINEFNTHYNLVIDERVTQKVIDSVKDKLSVYPKMRFFRVYKKDSANYGKYNFSNPRNDRKEWNWYGKYE
ncbi:hypothetical protein [Lutibacter maritimus]|uniref:Lipoprotein n=1 Tax=Lutibacter maritimus TaxID=593133 RepID=A0A1I6SW41_9FLAO|nr:hypothetical protein [Lutibacter maritimus]SFS81156.1 hypothetical protein SAMN04488006_0161 [Lutibacter maritimus]